MSSLPPAPPPPRSVGPPSSPQPFAAPPPGGPSALKPSGWWHVLGGVLMAVGVIGGLAIIGVTVVRSLSKVEDFDRVSVPGETVVSIEEAGGYTVYHEFPGASDISDLFSGDTVGLTVEIAAPDGSDVRLDRYSSDVSYEWEEFEGVALYSFRADEPGDYQVTAEGAVGTVAVGRGIGDDIVDDALGGIIGGLLFGLVAFVSGLVIVIVTAVKRGRRRRAQLYSGYGGGPGPTWGPGGYPPPGGPQPTWGPPPGSGPSPGSGPPPPA